MKFLLFLISLSISTILFNGCSGEYVASEPRYTEIERPVRPGNTHVWVDGYWVWNRQSNVYTHRNGYWAIPRHGRTYNPGQWRRSRRGMYWSNGYWH